MAPPNSSIAHDVERRVPAPAVAAFRRAKSAQSGLQLVDKTVRADPPDERRE